MEACSSTSCHQVILYYQLPLDQNVFVRNILSVVFLLSISSSKIHLTEPKSNPYQGHLMEKGSVLSAMVSIYKLRHHDKLSFWVLE